MEMRLPALVSSSPSLGFIFVLMSPFFIGADDDMDPQCSDRMVPDIFHGNIFNHLGPYNGVFIGTIFCTP